MIYTVNLAQALLDAGETQEALRLTEELVRHAPNDFPVAEKRCLALAACARWDAAQVAGQHARTLARRSGMALPSGLHRTLLELDLAWWRPQQLPGLTLRLPEARDTDFLRMVFTNPDFMRRYHRYLGLGNSAATDYLLRAQRSPWETRRREWVVADRCDQAVGLVALVDLEFAHRRGELLVGVPEASRTQGLALRAAFAALRFGFTQLGLNKLVSLVYADNPEAQANTLHLGFRPEGLLRQHLWVAGRPLDLHQNALLREDFVSHPLLKRLGQRWGVTPVGMNSAPSDLSRPRA